jgi:hypothetical protein
VTRYWIKNSVPKGAFGQYVAFLWDQVDSDTDGNSKFAADREWTELTIINRQNGVERVDVDPSRNNPRILEVRSELG